MEFAFRGRALSFQLLKFCGCLELCLYENLAKEVGFLKATKGVSNVFFDEKAPRAHYLKIGRTKMWVILAYQ